MTEGSSPTTVTTADLAGAWTLDPTRSEVHIGHKNFWGLGKVKGQFTTVSGEGLVDAEGNVTGRIVIAAASIDTKNQRRDNHLRSADFFDAERHPEFTVTVSSATVHGDHFHLDATFNARGVDQPLDLEGRITEATADTVKVVAGGKVDRTRHGMTWNRLGMMGGLTTVEVTATFQRAAA